MKKIKANKRFKNDPLSRASFPSSPYVIVLFFKEAKCLFSVDRFKRALYKKNHQFLKGIINGFAVK